MILPYIQSHGDKLLEHCFLASLRYNAQNKMKALLIENAWSLKCKFKQKEITNIKAKTLATDDCIQEL